jgi:signal peptidase II
MSMTRWLWVSVFTVVFDQASKFAVLTMMELYQTIAVMPFINFTYVHNTGAAFSFLSQAGGWQRWFFALFAIVMSLVLLVWLIRLKPHERLLAVALSLVLGGAIGNLIDRVALGYVIDFIDVYYQSWHWPVFNIADCAITIGVALLVLDSLLSKEVEG